MGENSEKIGVAILGGDRDFIGKMGWHMTRIVADNRTM